MERKRNKVNVKAREVVIDKIVEGKDVTTSKWWLERKQRNEFSTRQEVEHEGDITIHLTHWGDKKKNEKVVIPRRA